MSSCFTKWCAVCKNRQLMQWSPRYPDIIKSSFSLSFAGTIIFIFNDPDCSHRSPKFEDFSLIYCSQALARLSHALFIVRKLWGRICEIRQTCCEGSKTNTVTADPLSRASHVMQTFFFTSHLILTIFVPVVTRREGRGCYVNSFMLQQGEKEEKKEKKDHVIKWVIHFKGGWFSQDLFSHCGNASSSA